MPDSQTHWRTCNICEAMCGLEITHKRGQILSIRGDRADPLSRGHICPKAVALQDIHNDPDRLRYPMIKTPDGWERISWENAFNEAASRLRNIQAKHGRHAVAVYAGNPTIHNLGAMLAYGPFSAALGTHNRFSATSVDQLGAMLVGLKLYGNQLMIPVPDIDRTELFICIGANPVTSNGSLMAAPGFEQRIKAMQARGGRLICIDPRRTATADIADQHLFIKPGTDALLLLAILHTLFEEDLVNPGGLQPLLQGINLVRTMVANFPAEVVTTTVGIDSDTIRQLARTLANATSACVYGRMGTSTQAFGTLATWLINLVNILTGNLDRPGGMMFTLPAIDLVGMSNVMGETGSFNSRRSRVRGYPEFNGEFPAATLADEILTPGKDQIRALVTHAGNPALSLPGSLRITEALESLDFMVAIDFYINETTRHADLILPPSGPLEHDHYDLILNLFGVRNVARYSPALYKPMPDTRHDWEILFELSRRLQKSGPLKRASSELQYQMIKRLGPAGVVDWLLRLGPYGRTPRRLQPLQRQFAKLIRRRGQRPWLEHAVQATALNPGTPGDRRLSLRALEQNPSGIDLGPLQPCLPHRLHTPGQIIPLAPSLFLKDISRLSRWLQERNSQAPDAFLLIGRRDARSHNSWMHNSQRLVKGKARCIAEIHRDSAQRLGVNDGDTITVSSQQGEIELPATITDRVMPGVICIPHGWGHGQPATELQVANRHSGVNVNVITDDQFVDELSGVAAFSGQKVTVSTIKKDENIVRINDKRITSPAGS